MSDKFFYKGRQDARQHHTTYGGFKTRASQKSGSRKFPLKLTVTSEDRRQLIAAQVAEAGLHAEITLDTRDDAVESIAELTVVLNRTATVRQTRGPSRNEPCQCGSGQKFKKCCG
ncbi:MAG: SEC-C metal-binding domain-containing protein [Marinobacter sp.]|nr:SEC-C metal-binding domain-containing protein [Marinobacter sp.]